MLKLLSTIMLLATIPVFAGEVENNLNKGHNIFLYLYSADCYYCKEFTPRYNKLAKTHDGQFNFIKVDTKTPYGYSLISQYHGMYVPYVLLINKTRAVPLMPSCLSDMMCIEKSMKDFRG